MEIINARASCVEILFILFFIIKSTGWEWLEPKVHRGMTSAHPSTYVEILGAGSPPVNNAKNVPLETNFWPQSTNPAAAKSDKIAPLVLRSPPGDEMALHGCCWTWLLYRQ